MLLPLGEMARLSYDGKGIKQFFSFDKGKIMTVPKNYKMLPRARELRKDMTPQERKLWYMFLRNYPVKIYKQRIIESFIVDFYCASARLVIELDGSQHFTIQGLAYDIERTAILKAYNLKVLRFTNEQIDHHFSAVCNEIGYEITKRQELLNKNEEFV